MEEMCVNDPAAIFAMYRGLMTEVFAYHCPGFPFPVARFLFDKHPVYRPHGMPQSIVATAIVAGYFLDPFSPEFRQRP